MNDWLAVELAFSDLGNFRQSGGAFGFIAPAAAVPLSALLPPSPRLPLTGAFPSLPPFAATPIPVPPPAEVSVQSYSLSLRASREIWRSLSATWTLGVSRSSIDVDGAILTPVRQAPADGPGFALQRVPYERPDSEFGYLLGFGAEWAFTQRLRASLELLRRDTGVLQLDSLEAGLRFRL